MDQSMQTNFPSKAIIGVSDTDAYISGLGDKSILCYGSGRDVKIHGSYLIVRLSPVE
jgi:hypothetical protein